MNKFFNEKKKDKNSEIKEDSLNKSKELTVEKLLSLKLNLDFLNIKHNFFSKMKRIIFLIRGWNDKKYQT